MRSPPRGASDTDKYPCHMSHVAEGVCNAVLLTVERTSSLRSDGWHRPFCRAQPRVTTERLLSYLTTDKRKCWRLCFELSKTKLHIRFFVNSVPLLLLLNNDIIIIIIIIIIQKIPEQHTRKARNQGTTETNHIGHSTHTSESFM